MALRNPRGRPRHADILTPAEWRVVEAVRHGLSNPQIARRQGVSLDAVKYHVANALAKLGLTSRAELRRWGGVSRTSVLSQARSTAKGLPIGPLAQIARTVGDIEAASAWYRDILGLELLYRFPGMAFFRLGEIRLYLQETAKPADQSILYFSVSDIQQAHRELADRGVIFTSAPHMIHRRADGGEDWMAGFCDNEGRPLALMHHTPPMAAPSLSPQDAAPRLRQPHKFSILDSHDRWASRGLSHLCDLMLDSGGSAMKLTKLASVTLSVALAASLAACAKTEAAKPAADTAKIAEAVKADAAQLVTDFNAHDATKSVSHDAPQTVGMFHGAPNVNSPAEDLEITKKQAADTSTHVSVSDESVDVAQAGDMAIYRATYDYTQTDPKTKKPQTEHGNWLLIYKPQPDGSWKIVLSMISDTPPATKTASAADKK